VTALAKAPSNKVIITCAITGGIQTPTMTDALPYRPEDIAAQSIAAAEAGAVRVGLEDSLYIGRGKLASSNAEQVAKIRRILEELGHEIATPAEARAVLALKGGDKVGF
jgi:uncharacterized protein (DUF849 family)